MAAIVSSVFMRTHSAIAKRSSSGPGADVECWSAMELRKDPITRSWVLTGNGQVVATASPACAYCLPSEVVPPPQPIASVPLDGVSGGIRVYPHPHPLYHIEGKADRRADGIYDLMNGIGAHEIFIES